jgi:hypothetical protein
MTKLLMTMTIMMMSFMLMMMHGTKARFRRRISHVPNVMQMSKTLLFEFMCIRFGTCEMRRLN